jgi:hypothetical protein
LDFVCAKGERSVHSLVALDFLKIVAPFWLGNCPLFYHKLIALQNWIKHNDHCTLVIGGCIFGES